MHTAERINDHPHGRSAVPDSLQAVAPGPDYQWRRLSATGPEMKGGQIITKWLKAIKQVIQVLNFGNGP
jgi:hypothetical protein